MAEMSPNVLKEVVDVPRWVLAALTVAVMVVTGVLAWTATENQKCMESIAENIIASRKFAQHRAAAVDQLFRTIYNNPSDDGKELMAFHNYFTAYDRTTQQLRRLPVDPDQICD
jgi:hypothetical protein